jgi:hypothetical protein
LNRKTAREAPAVVILLYIEKNNKEADMYKKREEEKKKETKTTTLTTQVRKGAFLDEFILWDCKEASLKKLSCQFYGAYCIIMCDLEWQKDGRYV